MKNCRLQTDNIEEWQEIKINFFNNLKKNQFFIHNKRKYKIPIMGLRLTEGEPTTVVIANTTRSSTNVREIFIAQPDVCGNSKFE
jgi:hypothetical protein